MYSNKLKSNSILSEVNATWHCLGNIPFYRELLLLNGKEPDSSNEIDSKKIYEQIYLFLSSHTEDELSVSLYKMQKEATDNKISAKEFDFLTKELEIIFDLDVKSILYKKGAQRNENLVNSRVILFSILKKVYFIDAKEIATMIGMSHSIISRYIRTHTFLSDRIPNEKKMIEIYKTTITKLKTLKNGE